MSHIQPPPVAINVPRTGIGIALWAKLAAAGVCIIGILGVFLTNYVNGPDDVVEDFLTAIQEMDINEMIGCMDPKSEKQLNAVMGISGSVVGAVTGFDLDMSAAAELLPMFMDGSEYDTMEIEVLDTDVVYSGNAMADAIPFEIEGLDKIFAKDAEVSVTIMIDGETESDTVECHNYGWGNWRIEMEQFEDTW
ncbi:MAG: hypothetical protein PHP50_10960 [Lachnospiraceae bacterium]|nr:hypothetical protein [Lachnospiraceae bacterium]